MNPAEWMPYEAVRRGLLEAHSVRTFAEFWQRVREGHEPGGCRACQRWSNHNRHLDRVITEGAWWVRARAEEGAGDDT